MIFIQIQCKRQGLPNFRPFLSSELERISTQRILSLVVLSLNSDRMVMWINSRELIRIRPIHKPSLRNGKMKEITDDQGKQVQQLAALERVMKKQERDTRAE